jgi:PAS domain-containing protein
LEAAPDAMVVMNEAEIVLVNTLVEKQFGYRRDELVGQKIKKIIPKGFAERLIADSTRSVADALAQHIGAGIEPFAAEPVERPKEQYIKASYGRRPKHELKLLPVGGLAAQPVNKLLNYGPRLRHRESPKLAQLVQVLS